jgi:UDP-2-acetamido-2-deoxy-ribo-hexuluronate aminotransferase
MINFFKQDINKVLFKNALDNFKNDLWVNGKIIHEFENNLKKSLKIQHNVSSCNSGSDALLLCLLMDKHNNKDIYITTPISYLASSSIPRFLGLNLIYIDVEENGYTMCIKKLEYFLKNCPIKIKRRLKGIINVELFGTTCDLIKLKKISSKK